MATIQVSVVTPGILGAIPVPSRLDRALDEALNVLVWEGVVALAIVIIAAPFALIIAATGPCLRPASSPPSRRPRPFASPGSCRAAERTTRSGPFTTAS